MHASGMATIRALEEMGYEDDVLQRFERYFEAMMEMQS